MRPEPKRFIAYRSGKRRQNTQIHPEPKAETIEASRNHDMRLPSFGSEYWMFIKWVAIPVKALAQSKNVEKPRRNSFNCDLLSA
jgi:hypothetical protein